jgi:hypothetical protein
MVSRFFVLFGFLVVWFLGFLVSRFLGFLVFLFSWCLVLMLLVFSVPQQQEARTPKPKMPTQSLQPKIQAKVPKPQISIELIPH